VNQADYRVRRATLDDRKALVALWTAMQFPAADMERKLTEFQVVETSNGEVLGTLAIEIAGRHGRLHSEAFGDFSLADILRTHLWQRMQSVAANHGLARIWTQEKTPFWCHCGLHIATANELKRLPEPWAALPGEWRTQQLRDEDAIATSLDKEFAQFKEAARLQTQDTLRRARVMKYFATFIAIVLAVLVIVASLWLLKSHGVFGAPQQ
jgi:N-acetylglutamate synthase-like GNAT family acetyltransferase